MKVILASPRGFCAGVDRAIEAVQAALERFGPPVYVYHEIVHNRHVVEDLKRKGAVFVDRVADVPDGAVLLFSAHGIPPEVRQQAAGRGLTNLFGLEEQSEVGGYRTGFLSPGPRMDRRTGQRK